MTTALIIPCYNEENRLNPREFLDFSLANTNIDLWFVNDGSTDKTFDILQLLIKKNTHQLKLYSLKNNKGKAEAIRETITKINELNKYKYIGFIDADLATPLNEIVFFLDEMEKNPKLLITAGCRINIVGKNIIRKPIRHSLSRIFVTYYFQFLKIPNYDAQCGIKIFENKFALQLFDKPFLSKWMFDIELFVRALKFLGEEKYHLQIKEIPLNNWSEKADSKLKITSFILAPFEVVKIYFKYKN
jgi:dolichyl-phosphate beta-glucosyltransferase